jgi:hypothetical protein
MVRMGIPEKFADFMDRINRFPIDIELAKQNELNALSKIFNYTYYDPKFKFRKMSNIVREAAEFRHSQKYRPLTYVPTTYMEKNYITQSSIQDLISKYMGMPYYMVDKEKLDEIIYGLLGDVGVPQGASTSCSLATLAIRYVEERVKSLGLEMVAYADDVILAGPTEFDPQSVLENQNLGLRVN